MTDYPPGVRQRLLLTQSGPSKRKEEKRLADRFEKMLDKGRAAERLEKLDVAIQYYENVLADHFEGSFPYDRLRIIYVDQKKYAESERVCRYFVAMLDAMSAAGVPSVNEKKRQTFLDLAGRYAAKVAGG